MKFSHSLQFNSVPDWADKYLAYSNLKKAIYQLEQSQPVDGSTENDVAGTEESQALLSSGVAAEADRVFLPLLDKELKKIVAFYAHKEAELNSAVEQLRVDLERRENEDVRPSIEGVFSDPRKYNQASREERDLRGYTGPRRPRRVSSSGGAEDGTTAAGAASASRPANSRRRSSLLVDTSGAGPTAAETAVPDVLAIADARRQERSPTRRWSNLFRRRSQVGSGKRSIGLVIPPSPSGNFESARGDEASSVGDGRSLSIWTAENDWAIDLRITFKKRITDLFVGCSELKQFVQLNETGIKKICKKYDKVVNSNLKSRYMGEVVAHQYPFEEATRQKLDEHIALLTTFYAKVVTTGDLALALSQLKTHLREQVVWQRNTVWREMIGIERRAQGATLERSVMGTQSNKGGEEVKPLRLWTPLGYTRLPGWLGVSTLQLIIAFTMLTLLLKAPGLRFFARVEEQNCLAMLIFCTILWATEVIPLFVTSLMVPFLVVTLRVARTDDIEDRRMSASETTHWIFSQMFAPNMCLLIGGFTLAAALSKYNIDKFLAQKVLRMAGTRPAFVLLAHMGVACFASMWISNVAAPVLLFSLIQPILRNLPANSSFAPALIMGIALASNIGGQTSPIASPQNLIALQYMGDAPVGWLQWFAITIPVSGLSLIIIWLVLLWSYGSGHGTIIKRPNENKDSFTGIQYFISAVSIATIALWCLERNFEYVLGDMGVIAIVPMVLFFGTGILTKEDFNNFLWTIVFLAMGGIALGKAVTSSGLLESLDALVQRLVTGMPIWQVLFSLLAIGLVVATFISHTIAAVLLVPIAAEVGGSLAQPHPRLLIMATTLTASAAMGLPVSGFPNMAASAQEDQTGKRYVSVKDFLRVGILASVLATAVVGTVGFGVMSLLGL
ncbi:probable pho91-similarity to pho87p and pho90p [Ceraceosorus bombacis]|uniref:Probable pho91-similarity to pho87p and pho90p n=1 Tax=Ceraceosorus bombacis TaxID=401625 RepID=A0A0P1BAR2_9BASI|nr:probable pho91-similarity to pho87p and pho90p [Ceraceosorus bombacis]